MSSFEGLSLLLRYTPDGGSYQGNGSGYLRQLGNENTEKIKKLPNIRKSRVRLPAGAGNVSPHHHVEIGPESHTVSYPMGTGGPRSSAEDKNTWNYTSTPTHNFMAWCLVKRRGNYAMKTYWGSRGIAPLILWSRHYMEIVSRDGSVGIALGYRLDNRGSRVRFPAGAGNFSLHHRV
jgi:hypothetical protein